MYSSKYYTCEEIDERLLQGYYNDAVAAGYQGTKEEFIEGLRNLLENPQVTADNAILLPGTGLNAATSQQAFTELATAVFPLQARILSQGSNGGNHEITDAQHPVIPTFSLEILRRGSDVSSEATIVVESHIIGSGSYSEVSNVTFSNGILTCPSIINSMVYRIRISQGGQTITFDGENTSGEYSNLLRFSFMNYRYYGAVSTKPVDSNAVKALCQGNSLTKQLSTSTTLGKTPLAANKYFVFVVPNTGVNLVVKNANSGGIVSNAGSGTFEISRVNGTANVNCKYVIVPASSISWNFEIQN